MAIQDALVTSGLNNVEIYNDPDAAENNAYILFGVNDDKKLTISLAYSGGSDYYLYGSEMTFLEIYEDLMASELCDCGNELLHERVTKHYSDNGYIMDKLDEGAYDHTMERVCEEIRNDTYGDQLYKFCCNSDNIGRYSAIVSAFTEEAPDKARAAKKSQKVEKAIDNF